MDALKEFMTGFEAETRPEEKLKLCLAFMRKSLGGQSPNFRDFWEVQKLCLPLFKENLAAAERNTLWGEYVEISKEVRRMRAMLDEQASFAQEQIGIALTAIEGELNALDERLLQMPAIEIPANSQILGGKIATYDALQRKVALLGQLATRLQSLRKEVLASSMRARTKNQLLESLSKVGDRIFPQRKEVLAELSNLYQAEVENFVKEQFPEGGRFPMPFYALKDEIRAFQALAKQLMLSTPVFQETRAKLSQCWDLVRAKDEERKKRQAEKPAREEKPKKERPVQVEKKQPEAPKLSPKVEGFIARSIQGENEDVAIEEEARRALDQTDDALLKTQLDKLAERRKEIKKALEIYRKEMGGSALNIQESMGYQELLERDRSRLDQIESVIHEIQDRLFS